MKVKNNLFLILKVTYFLVYFINKNLLLFLDKNKNPGDIFSFFKNLSIAWRNGLDIEDEIISNIY